MEAAAHLRFVDIVMMFFITMGPMRILLPFGLETRQEDTAFRLRLALRVTGIATAIVVTVALLGPFIMERWGVSTVAIAMTGALVLFFQAFRQIGEQPVPAQVKAPEKPASSPQSMTTRAFALAVPGVVSPAAIAFIVSIRSVHTAEWIRFIPAVIGVLLLLMLLNLAFMLAARWILRFVRVRVLFIVRWIFALFQAFLALQIILQSLHKLSVIKVCGSVNQRARAFGPFSLDCRKK